MKVTNKSEGSANIDNAGAFSECFEKEKLPYALDYIDRNFRTILFSGFHYLPEHQAGGWVYWLPQYLYKHTSLQIFFISSNETVQTIDSNGNIKPIEK